MTNDVLSKGTGVESVLCAGRTMAESQERGLPLLLYITSPEEEEDLCLHPGRGQGRGQGRGHPHPVLEQVLERGGPFSEVSSVTGTLFPPLPRLVVFVLVGFASSLRQTSPSADHSSGDDPTTRRRCLAHACKCSEKNKAK